jgi:hypothetical protein
MVGDCFAEDFAAIQPNQTSIQDFADYLVEWYIAEDSHFPPYMWAENSSSSQRTTNACEGFHSKFNASFYCGHPNIFQFTEVLKNFQIDTVTGRRRTSGRSPRGAKHQGGKTPRGRSTKGAEAPQTSESSLMKGGATECRGRLR